MRMVLGLCGSQAFAAVAAGIPAAWQIILTLPTAVWLELELDPAHEGWPRKSKTEFIFFKIHSETINAAFRQMVQSSGVEAANRALLCVLSAIVELLLRDELRC